MGQDRAVRHVADILKRSVYSLSGSPTNYIRFDMSEFGHDHADQRLIGSPPGYVGYEVGGELTNAVKQNPFSVILFDEVEKAHPKILDMFLQILDDGRQKINSAIDDFFRYRINRPEILNRIGKNVIVFDFIRPDTAEKILDKMLANVIYRLKDSHGIDLILSDSARKTLSSEAAKDLTMGGRGVGNTIEDVLINPLSRALFENPAGSGGIMTLGPGRRLGLWLQGCDIHCEGCIAPELQDFDEKYAVSIDELMREILPVLAGAEGVRDILLYTGRKIEEVPAEILGMVSAVVDGAFVKGAATTAKWKGSENQTLTVLREEFRGIYEVWQKNS